jgi:hypothetical protein
VRALGSSILTNPSVSKLPYGLLGFLGIKNGGQYPGFLGDTIQPIINYELMQLYLSTWGEEFHFASGGVAAGAGAFQTFNTALTVPLGEVWYVGLLSVRIQTGAGEALTANLAVRRPNAAATSNHVALGISTTVGASQFFDLTMDRPFFAGNGDEIGLWLSALTGAPTVRPDIRFLRMPT